MAKTRIEKIEEPDLPEHKKLEAVRGKSQAIGEFLEWVQEEKKLQFAFYHTHGPGCDGWDEDEQAIVPRYEYDCGKRHDHDAVLCEKHRAFGCDMPEESLVPARINIEKLLAEFFDINLVKLEAEKDLLLNYVRKLNDGKK